MRYRRYTMLNKMVYNQDTDPPDNNVIVPWRSKHTILG